MRSASRILWCLATLLVFVPPHASAIEIEWEQSAPGLRTARYEISRSGSVLRSVIVLVRFDQRLFRFVPVQGSDVGTSRSDVRRLTTAVSGLAGINANFFDPLGAPLGLLIKNGKTLSKLHRGGNTLTALLVEHQGRWKILHRTEYKEGEFTTAVQAGPRLFSNGSAVPDLDSQESSRRSGLAILSDGSIVFFATLLRFPGATLPEIQEMLRSLGAQDAINFDGGSSSQLYVSLGAGGKEDIIISGGELIPVVLAAVRR